MQFQLEESTLSKEFWPLRGAYWWWLPQISAVLGLGPPRVVAAWGLGKASPLSRPGSCPGWQGDISNEPRSAKPCSLRGSEKVETAYNFIYFPPSLLFFNSPFPSSHTPEAEETHSTQA